MLLNDFFDITESTNVGGKLISQVKLNADHKIYGGHFPGNPVTPGVVQMQMVKEILEKHFGKELKLVTMSRCKFLKVLSPVATPSLFITIEITEADGVIKINTSGQEQENTFFKFSATYQ